MSRAFLFPGQGSQRVGMGRELAARFPSARALFEEADEAVGFALSRICFEGPEEELARTATTQPAILTTSVAAWRVLEAETGLAPDLVAGHSLGEYSALVCAGALAFRDAVRLVHLRGRFMQEAVPEGVGGMAAIVGLEARAVEDCCREAASGEGGGYVAPANFNGGGQVVVAGEAAAVDRVVALAKAKGAKLARRLPVSAPFHCRLMEPAAARLAEELARVAIEAPTRTVISNVEAAPYPKESGGAGVRDLLVRQVTAPVRWEESVRALVAMGADEAYEIGPGKVLAGLLRRIAPGAKVTGVEGPDDVAAIAAAGQGGANG